MSDAFRQRYVCPHDVLVRVFQYIETASLWEGTSSHRLLRTSQTVQALLQSSHMYYDAMKNFEGHGVVVGDVKVDLPKMMEQKTKSVDGLTKGIEGLFKKNKVKYVKGWGSFVSPTEIKVALSDGGEETISTKNVMIATGSEPSSIPGLEIDEDRHVSKAICMNCWDVSQV